MAKKRKTRRQKINATSRLQVLDGNTIEILTETKPSQAPSINPSIPNTYLHVASDAKRTLLTIASITALNIALYFALKSGILKFFDLKF